MRFSTESENLLKSFFTSKDREQVISIVDKRLEEMTDRLHQAIGSEYSTLVDACDILDILWDKVNELKIMSAEVSRLANNLLTSINESKEQEKELAQCYDRISMVQKELLKLERFIEQKDEVTKLLETLNTNNNEQSTSNDRTESEYFKIVRDIAQMESQIDLFKNYYFYGIFLEEIGKIKESFELILKKNMKKFLNQDWNEIGKELEITRRFKIFDEIGNKKHNICNEQTRETIYCIRQLKCAIPIIELLVTEERTKMFEETEKQGQCDPEEADKVVCFYIGNILLSYILSDFLPNVEPFYSHMFVNLSKYSKCKTNLISKLRMLAEKLGVSNSDLDHSIETIVYSYFEDEFNPKTLLKLSNDDISQRIFKGYDFLKSINSYENEFDEVFLKKIDNALLFVLNSTPFEHFFTRLDDVQNIISKLKSKDEHFNDYSFECIDEIQRSVWRLSERQVDDIKAFAKENDNESIVKKIIALRDVKSKDFKVKFVQILTDKVDGTFENKSPEDKALFLDTARRNLL